MGASVAIDGGYLSNFLYRVRRADRALAWDCKEVPKDPGKRTGGCQTQIDEVEVVIMARKNVGSDFDDFLKVEGLLEDVTAVAVKRYVAYQLIEKMAESNLSKAEMARRMDTSRSALDRLLDPDNSSVTLQTLQSAVQALGGRLKIELEFRKHAA
jgi:DNA-binding phage protein